MTDMTEIIKSIPPDYKKQKSINGVMRDTYFFFSWAGYTHPMQMIKPASYKDVQKVQEDYYSYYEASFDLSHSAPLLIFVEKFILERIPISINEGQLNKNNSVEDLYYLVRKKGDEIVLDKEVTLDDTFEAKEYAHILLNDTRKIIKSELIKKSFEWSCAYEYDKEDQLLKVTMKNGNEDTKTLERGKGL